MPETEIQAKWQTTQSVRDTASRFIYLFIIIYFFSRGLGEKRTVALNLALAKSADFAGEGAKGEESVVLSENEESATGPRAGFSGLSRCVHSNANANANAGGTAEERGGIDAPPKDDKSFFRLSPSFHLSFGSFDLASIAITRSKHAVSSRFRFLGNWFVRCCLRHRESVSEYDSIKFLSFSLFLFLKCTYIHSLSLNRSLVFQTGGIKALDWFTNSEGCSGTSISLRSFDFTARISRDLQFLEGDLITVFRFPENNI